MVTAIQYIRPNGYTRIVTLKTDYETERKFELLKENGYRLEAEILPTDEVSFTISDDDGDYFGRIVDNGPDVPQTVVDLVSVAYASLL